MRRFWIYVNDKYIGCKYTEKDIIEKLITLINDKIEIIEVDPDDCTKTWPYIGV